MLGDADSHYLGLVLNVTVEYLVSVVIFENYLTPIARKSRPLEISTPFRYFYFTRRKTIFVRGFFRKSLQRRKFRFWYHPPSSGGRYGCSDPFSERTNMAMIIGEAARWNRSKSEGNYGENNVTSSRLEYLTSPCQTICVR